MSKKETVLSIVKDIRTLLKPKFQKAQSPNSARYLVNGDGTITDTLWGIAWLEDADAFNSGKPIKQYYVIEYLSKEFRFNDETYRLPSYHELTSIVEFSRHPDALINPVFKNQKSDWYWTSQDYVPPTAGALIVGFGSGSVTSGTKIDAYYVRPVRVRPVSGSEGK